MVAESDKLIVHTRYASLHSLVFFFFLLFLPLTTTWLVLSSIQDNLERDQQRQSLDEMAEMTAHMARLANHETYFQETLRRISDSFRWAMTIDDILCPFNSEVVEIFLFDKTGKRLPWPNKNASKRKISEDYINVLSSLRHQPGISLSRRDQSIATAFSGNYATAHSLARSPETMVNFQGLGLRKYGIWLEPKLPEALGDGHLLAWLNPDKIDRYELAKKAVSKIQRLAGKDFIFAWLDLNNPEKSGCGGGFRLKTEGRQMLSKEGLKSAFRFDSELFAINDTPEGIRLICSRHLPPPPPIKEFYISILRTILPVLILLLLWKAAFMVRLDLSAGLQFSLVFGFTALTGIAILLAGTMAWQYEKHNSLVAEYKQRAVQILEKIDRNFSASYGDLLRQYRHLNQLIRVSDSTPTQVLAPLAAAQAEDNLAFASYTDRYGNFLFKAPQTYESGNSASIESKYANLIGGVSAQLIKSFNSSKMPGNAYAADPIGVKTLSNRPIEGLLANRSTLQNITFDGDETITFMDLTIDETDTASGCLFIVHEPRKMELKYLSMSGTTLTGSTGFSLAAFPKKHSDRSSYYPKFSMTTELPLWKLQDLVNQTQVSSFKQGRIDGREVLVGAIPGHNLKNYNLFLIMPFEPIKKEARRLTILFISATVLSLIFIAFLSMMLIRSLITPVEKLAANATALQNTVHTKTDTPVFCDGNELESISTGLTDLILKVREFNEGRSIKRHLLPPDPLTTKAIVIDGFQIARSNEEKEIYHFARLDDSLSLAFMMRTDLGGIEASLTLSMARMAVRLISEELNVHSAFHCLKDLEEYFRINLRRKLTGDFLLILFQHEENKLSYCGCGAIKLVFVDSVSGAVTKKGLPDCEMGSREFFEFGNQEMNFATGQFCLAVSSALHDQCTEQLSTLLPVLIKQNSEQQPLRELLQNEVEKVCSKDFFESASLIIAQHFNERKDCQ